jgi:hypothetical protein
MELPAQTFQALAGCRIYTPIRIWQVESQSSLESKDATTGLSQALQSNRPFRLRVAVESTPALPPPKLNTKDTSEWVSYTV